MCYSHLIMQSTSDSEYPIADLQSQMKRALQLQDTSRVGKNATINELAEKLEQTRQDIYSNLTGWQIVQMSRHPDRPQTFDYISMICDEFIELHGDRTVRDDKAIIGGFASINGQSVMVIGHQ